MVLNPAIPRNARVRPGWVEVQTRDGRRFEGRVAATKGDPGNTLTREELEVKAQQLAAHASAATPEEMRRIISRVWKLRDAPDMSDLYLGK